MYPLEVEINEKNLAKVINTYKAAYKKIVNEIANATDFGVANRRQILSQIEKILTKLGVDTDAWIRAEIPSYYEAGADDGVKQLNNIGAPVKVAEGFNRIHQDAITGLVDDTAKSFAEGLAGVNRSGQLLFGRFSREAITQEMAEGLISGKALTKVRQQIKGKLLEDGLTAIVDRGGRGWTLDRYAEMLFRTKAVEARNRGIANRLVENGYDLVQVSNHGMFSCPLCMPWQGKILSASGQTRGYPTVLDAERSGLFHPNCRHAINVLVPKIAHQTQAYNPKKKTLYPAGASMRKPIEDLVKSRQIELAEKHQEIFKNRVGKIASTGNWEVKVGDVKSVERATDKVIDDYNGDVYGLKDANRATIIIKNPWDKDEFNKLVNAASDYYHVNKDLVKEKNRLNNESGYASAMINVDLPYGRTGEIQVTYKEMYRAKNELGGHDLYKVVRSKQGNYEKAREEMDKIYSEAVALAKERAGMGKP